MHLSHLLVISEEQISMLNTNFSMDRGQPWVSQVKTWNHHLPNAQSLFLNLSSWLVETVPFTNFLLFRLRMIYKIIREIIFDIWMRLILDYLEGDVKLSKLISHFPKLVILGCVCFLFLQVKSKPHSIP